jgi:hypothetical protein
MAALEAAHNVGQETKLTQLSAVALSRLSDADLKHLVCFLERGAEPSISSPEELTAFMRFQTEYQAEGRRRLR